MVQSEKENTNPLLEVKKLTTMLRSGKIPYEVVDHLSFILEKGKTLALVGESGCGKTMSALSLLRILPPAALPPTGEVLYKNTNILLLPEANMRAIRGKQIAMVFQDPTSALNPVYTIGEQIIEAIEIHLKCSFEEAKDRAVKMLQEVGIPSPEERLAEYPHQLSGGLKQRAMIAMALACEPEILIADEPTTALDVTIQAQVLELLQKLQHERQMALLLITHDIGVVAEIADSVIVMYGAQAIERGSVTDIFDRMSHPYTKGLFESRPPNTLSRSKLRPIQGSVASLLSPPPGCRFHPRCPYVMEKCKTGDVPEFRIDQSPTHTSRCWLNDGSEESVQKLITFGGLHATAAS